MNVPKLSALVVAHNEEAQLAECLETLSFADEIVVVLDDCTDGSKDIAGRFTPRLIEGSWDIEGPRRNAGIDGCKGDWILEIDADERVSDDLAKEICDTIQSAEPGFFLIPFDNFVGERLVRYGWGGSWGVSATERLFSRGAKRWGENQRIHPKTELKGPKRWLKCRMIHHVDQNISDMIQRLDRYTAAKAADMRANGSKEGFWRNFRRLFTRFWKCYISRKGYKEGYYGFLIALFAAIWPMISWLRYKLEDD
jgi:glycosyltransferase involved in cell wall biosynthesis